MASTFEADCGASAKTEPNNGRANKASVLNDRIVRACVENEGIGVVGG